MGKSKPQLEIKEVEAITELAYNNNKIHRNETPQKTRAYTHLNLYRDQIKNSEYTKTITKKKKTDEMSNVGAEITIKMKNIFLIN